jgi:hypothetical protein
VDVTIERQAGEISNETPSRPVGLLGKKPHTSTPVVRPKQLNFMDELAEKQREMGLSLDRPANFGCRRVIDPRVSD